ncbi:hypothetical protein OAO01_01485 [Oligoflexia bacterium]|nr:hypothetical protein [Oligoflexia bacterium]
MMIFSKATLISLIVSLSLVVGPNVCHAQEQYNKPWSQSTLSQISGDLLFKTLMSLYDEKIKLLHQIYHYQVWEIGPTGGFIFGKFPVQKGSVKFRDELIAVVGDIEAMIAAIEAELDRRK